MDGHDLQRVLTGALPHEAVDSQASAHERIRDVCAKILCKDRYQAASSDFLISEPLMVIELLYCAFAGYGPRYEWLYA